MDARCRGRVRLTSPDPAATLDIDHRYFSDPADLDAMCDGVELALRLAATPPLAEVVEPGSGFTPPAGGREGLRAWIREQAGTTFHPSSTCRMGPAGDPERSSTTPAGSTGWPASAWPTPPSSRPAHAPTSTARSSPPPRNSPMPSAAPDPV